MAKNVAIEILNEREFERGRELEETKRTES